MWFNKGFTFLIICSFSLFTTSLYANTHDLNVTWPCPQSRVNVSFNLLGQPRFSPDIFSQQVSGTYNREECLATFYENLVRDIRAYKDANCSQNLSSLRGTCIAPSTLLNRRIMRAAQQSPLLNSASFRTNDSGQTRIPDPRRTTMPSDATRTPHTRDGSHTTATQGNAGAGQSQGRVSTSPQLDPIAQKAYVEAYLLREMDQGRVDIPLNGVVKYQGRTIPIKTLGQVVSRKLDAEMASMSPEQQKAFLQNYILANSNYLTSDSAFNTYCRNLSPQNCATERRSRDMVHDNIRRSFRIVSPQQANLTNEISCDEGTGPLLSLLNDVQNSIRAAGCRELQPGEAKVFHQDHNNYYGTGNYSLKRLDNNNYQVKLNVNFKDGGAAGGGAAMLERARACAAQASPHLKGPPPENQKIQLQLFTPQEITSLPVNERPRQLDIHVDRPGRYASTIDFQDWFTCSQIVHEFLHHLGLCDEYNPVNGSNVTTGLANANIWACRVQTQGVSIMKLDSEAWRRTVGPIPFRQSKLPSLLRPNHFYKILEGTCKGRSASYQECADWAYKSVECNAPAECRDDRYFLGDVQR